MLILVSFILCNRSLFVLNFAFKILLRGKTNLLIYGELADGEATTLARGGGGGGGGATSADGGASSTADNRRRRRRRSRRMGTAGIPSMGGAYVKKSATISAAVEDEKKKRIQASENIDQCLLFVTVL